MNSEVKIKPKKGFSIIEVLMAAFILSVGITAVLGLMANSIRNSLNSRNEIIASELAQEGIELVRNVRDNNWAIGNISFYPSTFPSSGGDCSVDPSIAAPYTINNCGLATNFALGHYAASGFISNAYITMPFNITSKTIFSRKVNIAYSGSGSDQMAVVKSFVDWDGTGTFPSEANCNIANKCVLVVDNLTKWDEQ